MGRTGWTAMAALALMAGPVAAQQETPRVPEATARAAALARVPGGTVKSEELEQEEGKLIYSYDIVVAGRDGVEEVTVDANTGAVLGVHHEDAAAERAEAAHDRGELRKAEAEMERQEARSREEAEQLEAAREQEAAEELQEGEELEAAGVIKPAPYAQWLAERTVAAHAPVVSVEVALVQDGVCRTMASTALEDVLEECDADETGPMTTGRPSIKAPTAEDPVYDITQTLHDANGTVVGAVGLDIEPGDLSRDQVVELARKVVEEMEAQIPSQGRLFEAPPRP